MRFLEGIRAKGWGVPVVPERTSINGQPGFLLRGPDGIESIALEITGESLSAVYYVRNPDKLRHLS